MQRRNTEAAIGALLRSPRGIACILAGIGFGVWISLSLWAGVASGEAAFRLREAWDDPTYFFIGMPAMAAAVAVAGFLQPSRVWRWPLSLVTGHQAGLLLVGVGMQSAPSLALLAVILAAMMGAVLCVPAIIGAVAARHLAERAT
jgi:hypothetical protein